MALVTWLYCTDIAHHLTGGDAYRVFYPLMIGLFYALPFVMIGKPSKSWPRIPWWTEMVTRFWQRLTPFDDEDGKVMRRNLFTVILGVVVFLVMNAGLSQLGL